MTDAEIVDKLLSKAQEQLDLQSSPLKAKEIAKRATVIAPQSDYAWFLLASACMQLGEFFDASEHLKRMLQITPQAASAWALLAMLLTETGDFSDAVSCANEAIRIDAEAADLVGASLALCIAYNNLRQFRKSLEASEAAHGGYDQSSSLLDARSQAQLGLERYDEARLSAEQGLKLAPDDLALRHSRILALIGLGEHESALALASDTLDTLEGALNDSRLWQSKVIALDELGKYDDAAEAASLGLGFCVDSDHLWWSLVLVLMKKGRSQEALAAVQDGIHACPSTWVLWPLYGYLLQKAEINPAKHPLPASCVARGIATGEWRSSFIEEPFLKAGTVLRETDSQLLLEHRLLQCRRLYPLSSELGRGKFLDDYLSPVLLALDEIGERNTSTLDLQSLLDRTRLQMTFGDWPGAYKTADQLDRADDTLVAGQLYFLWAASACIDDDLSAIEHARMVAYGALAGDETCNAEDYYYAGHIFHFLDETDNAIAAFDKAGDFLPAMYMSWYLSCSPSNSVEQNRRFLEILRKEASLIESGNSGLLIPPAGMEECRGNSADHLLPAVHRFEVSDAINALLKRLDAVDESNSRGQFRRLIANLTLLVKETGDIATAWQDWLMQWENEPSYRELMRAFKRTRRQEWIDSELEAIRPFLAAMSIEELESESDGPQATEHGIIYETRIASHIASADLRASNIPVQRIAVYGYVRGHYSARAVIRLLVYHSMKEKRDKGLMKSAGSVDLLDILSLGVAAPLWYLAADSGHSIKGLLSLVATQPIAHKLVMNALCRFVQNGDRVTSASDYEELWTRLREAEYEDPIVGHAIQEIADP